MLQTTIMLYHVISCRQSSYCVAAQVQHCSLSSEYAFCSALQQQQQQRVSFCGLLTQFLYRMLTINVKTLWRALKQIRLVLCRCVSVCMIEMMDFTVIMAGSAHL